MDSNKVLYMELALHKEYEGTLGINKEDLNETQKAMVKAFEAIRDYRIVLEKEEARRAATQAD